VVVLREHTTTTTTTSCCHGATFPQLTRHLGARPSIQGCVAEEVIDLIVTRPASQFPLCTLYPEAVGFRACRYIARAPHNTNGLEGECFRFSFVG